MVVSWGPQFRVFCVCVCVCILCVYVCGCVCVRVTYETHAPLVVLLLHPPFLLAAARLLQIVLGCFKGKVPPGLEAAPVFVEAACVYIHIHIYVYVCVFIFFIFFK
jgi:hypothetical protein